VEFLRAVAAAGAGLPEAAARSLAANTRTRSGFVESSHPIPTIFARRRSSPSHVQFTNAAGVSGHGRFASGQAGPVISLQRLGAKSENFLVDEIAPRVAKDRSGSACVVHRPSHGTTWLRTSLTWPNSRKENPVRSITLTARVITIARTAEGHLDPVPRVDGSIHRRSAH